MINDPVKGCDVYKDIGCTHVDGFLCDYPNCSILKDYRMNERIKELEKQATTVVEGWSDENGTTRYYEFDRKKFAELIIKETLEVARAGVEYGDGMEDAVYRYFGVEE
jgi:hypothetical protein